jgi:hypothetical protein
VKREENGNQPEQTFEGHRVQEWQQYTNVQNGSSLKKATVISKMTAAFVVPRVEELIQKSLKDFLRDL